MARRVVTSSFAHGYQLIAIGSERPSQLRAVSLLSALSEIPVHRSPAVAPLALIALLLAPFAGANAQSLKVLNLPDYGRWNRITSTALSPDGKWISYAYQPNDGNATLFIKQLDGDKVFTIPVGAAPAAG